MTVVRSDLEELRKYIGSLEMAQGIESGASRLAYEGD